MIKPDDETTAALARFSRTAEWNLIEKWLVSSREDCVQHSLSPDEVRTRQAQGKLLAIDTILKATRSAESLTRR